MVKRKLLIVEDSIEIQVLLKRLLESEGFDVVCASHGKQAIDILEHDTLPNLILLDLMMPVMDGFEFRDRQLKDPRFKEIPVIIMTADGSAQAKKERISANDFLKKPLDVDQLLQSIDRQVPASG